MKNHLKEIQDLMLKQMHRLDESVAKGEIQIETNRSGALTQNASAYLKTLNISLRVKEMSKNNQIYEKRIMEEIGAIEDE